MAWEAAIYNQILDAYQSHVGRDLQNDPFVYQQLIKIVNSIKDEVEDVDTLKNVVTNAIVLLLTLFFDKKFNDDFDDEQPLSATDRKTISSVLRDAYNIATEG
jgi:RNAse (barnase) inhibitor barstar